MPFNLQSPKIQPLLTAIRARYAQEGPKGIATEFGYLPGSVTGVARRLGIRSLTRFQRGGETIAANNKTVDQRFFDAWSPSMAYVLGYIWADGCVRPHRWTVGFLCTRSDEDLLLAIRMAMGWTGRIYRGGAYVSRFSRGDFISKPRSSFKIHSKCLYKVLTEKHGLQPRKSFKDLPFPDVPDGYLAHFARGYFDGDGSVWLRETRNGGGVSFVGTHLFIGGLNRAIARVAHVRARAVYTKDRISRAEWEAKREVISLYHFLYPPNANLFLLRKREVFRHLLANLEGVRGRNRALRSDVQSEG